MITSRQIRAARAYLDWDYSDISERTGLHRNTLASAESGEKQPRKSTLSALINCFASQGIFFEDGCIKHPVEQTRDSDLGHE